MTVLGSLGATSLSLGLFLYLSHSRMFEKSEIGYSGPRYVIVNSRVIRLAIFLISSTLIAVCAVFSVVSLFENNAINRYNILYFVLID